MWFTEARRLKPETLVLCVVCTVNYMEAMGVFIKGHSARNTAEREREREMRADVCVCVCVCVCVRACASVCVCVCVCV